MECTVGCVPYWGALFYLPLRIETNAICVKINYFLEELKMFEKNDKALLIARGIILFVICFLAIAFLVGGIVLAVIINGAFFLVSFAGIIFLCLPIWVFSQLYLSYLCDIKLIRNKLYGVSNTNLEPFLVSSFNDDNTRKEIVEMLRKEAETKAELQHLQQLLSSGIITTEEYENRKKELTERK